MSENGPDYESSRPLLNVIYDKAAFPSLQLTWSNAISNVALGRPPLLLSRICRHFDDARFLSNMAFHRLARIFRGKMMTDKDH